MSGIGSSTGMGLPPAATATTVAPTASGGVRVAGPGGATTLPAADASSFSGTSPTPLDTPDATFPTLTAAHVGVLRVIGTPSHVIQQIAAEQPQAAYMERYIQGEIMQNPEGWDRFVGNPPGTARAGLLQLMPSAQLPPVGAGTPGYLPDGSTVSGINVPGLTRPLMGPGGGAGEPGGIGAGMGAALAAAAAGVGFLGWKLLGNRGGGGGAAQATALLESVRGGASEAAEQGSRSIASFLGRGAKAAPAPTPDPGQLASLTLFTQGGGDAGSAAALAGAATAESIASGHGAANGFLTSVALSAERFGVPMNQAIPAALADRYMGVLETAARSGQLGDFAASHLAMKQALDGTVAGGGAGTLTGEQLRAILARAVDGVPM